MSDSNNKPMTFLIGTVIVAILLMAAIARIMRPEVVTDPFDAPAAESTPSSQP